MGRTACIEVYVPVHWAGDVIIVPYIRDARTGGAVASGDYLLVRTEDFSTVGVKMVLDCLQEYFVITQRTPSVYYEVLTASQRKSLSKAHYPLSISQDEETREVKVYGKTGTELLKSAACSGVELYQLVMDAMKFVGKEPPPPTAKVSPYA